MGFRTKLVKVKKKHIKDFRGKELDIFDKRLKTIKEVGVDAVMELKRKPLKNIEIPEDFLVFELTKEELKRLIYLYKEIAYNWLLEVEQTTKQREKDNMVMGTDALLYVKNKQAEFEIDLLRDLSNKDRLISSFSYEYGLFDLIYIYKTFNFKKYKLLIVGS